MKIRSLSLMSLGCNNMSHKEERALLMPWSFSLGQHKSLEAQIERLFTFFSEARTIVEEELSTRTHSSTSTTAKPKCGIVVVCGG